MIPAKMEAVLFGFVLSGLMSLIVAGVSTAVSSNGWGSPFLGLWARSWLTAWLLAFPTVLVVGPFARRVVQRLVRQN